MKKLVFRTEEEAGLYIARTIDTLLKENPRAVLCLAAGHTSLPVFDAMEALGTDFSKARVIGLDEWVGVPADVEGSCAYFLGKNCFSRINVKEENVVLFDAMATDLEAECHKMEAQIEAWGGMDYLLLGMGMNCHLALNEPGDSFKRGAHVAPLSETTKKVAPKYFPEGMPPITSGITLGIKNLLAARQIQLAVFGAHKAPAVARLLQSEPDEALPASALYLAEHAELVLDESCAN